MRSQNNNDCAITLSANIFSSYLVNLGKNNGKISNIYFTYSTGIRALCSRRIWQEQRLFQKQWRCEYRIISRSNVRGEVDHKSESQRKLQANMEGTCKASQRTDREAIIIIAKYSKTVGKHDDDDRGNCTSTAISPRLHSSNNSLIDPVYSLDWTIYYGATQSRDRSLMPRNSI